MCDGVGEETIGDVVGYVYCAKVFVVSSVGSVEAGVKIAAAVDAIVGYLLTVCGDGEVCAA